MTPRALVVCCVVVLGLTTTVRADDAPDSNSYVIGCTCPISQTFLDAVKDAGLHLPTTFPTTGKAAIFLPGLLSSTDRVDVKKLGDIDTKVEIDKSGQSDMDFGMTALVAIAFLKSIQDLADGVSSLAINGKLLWELSDSNRSMLRQRIKRAKVAETEFAAKVKLAEEELAKMDDKATGYAAKQKQVSGMKDKLVSIEIQNREMAERDKALPINGAYLAWEKMLSALYKVVSSSVTLALLSASKALSRLKAPSKREFLAVLGVCNADTATAATKKFSMLVDKRTANPKPETFLSDICSGCTGGTEFLKDYCV
eukprot:c6677_g1_i1.p1 GENE.c6677_g1_i1~~c6677_g1_i1.p1  ORF type:complete len:312 (-),score=90.20 c6677_g1_i1:63-998(-)